MQQFQSLTQASAVQRRQYGCIWSSLPVGLVLHGSVQLGFSRQQPQMSSGEALGRVPT